jgi:hypothetical protein
LNVPPDEIPSRPATDSTCTRCRAARGNSTHIRKAGHDRHPGDDRHGETRPAQRPSARGGQRADLAAQAPETLEADVVIVGSGISGALMAVALADGKRRIVIAERREPGRL